MEKIKIMGVSYAYDHPFNIREREKFAEFSQLFPRENPPVKHIVDWDSLPKFSLGIK